MSRRNRRPKPRCKCHRHPRQVCDICQNWHPGIKDQPAKAPYRSFSSFAELAAAHTKMRAATPSAQKPFLA